MNIRTLLKTLPLLTVILGLAACSTVAFDPAEQHTATFRFRTLTGLVNGTNQDAFNATVKAIRQLDLYASTSEKEKFSSTITARAPGDRKVRIEIKEINSLQTQVEIVWGGTGNKTQSVTLYQAIDKNMGGH